CLYFSACTADGHFVFAVYRTSAEPDIDPGSLMVAETTVYLAEVHGLVRRTGQVYGEITRGSSYRFQVECRYSKGNLASTGYLVVNPPPPSAALAFGSLGVRLMIATDASYTTFHPLSHLPLRFLLGSKVHLEVQLVNPPEPNVVLLVHYCIAYAQSSQAAWVIVCEG
ncbi:ZP1 protein, partial [Polyodon spathula]|nr:ZP1 protein [Polyodon spathula]